MNFIYYDEKLDYPSGAYYYSPSEVFPEYPFKFYSLSLEENLVYKSIRELFYRLGLDKVNFGTPQWNPLGKWIRPGMKVLLKPNLVNHLNSGVGNINDMASLVTHPSIIRCILDYCYIALGNMKTIVVGDAPVIGCSFAALILGGGYQQIEDFYKINGLSISFVDFRKQTDSGKAFGREMIINLGEDSLLAGLDGKKLRSPTYNKNLVIAHHNGTVHEYSLNSAVLKADVIINLPKPKSHRKNGYTGAIKNFVGVCYDKAYIPHHSKGCVSAGGDEYLHHNSLYLLESMLNDYIDTFCGRNCRKFFRYKTAYHLRELIIQCIKLSFSSKRKDFSEQARQGAWHGNDTLWRTTNDILTCVCYASKEGVICKEQQRKILSIGDMIVSGQHNGPLSPEPKLQRTLLLSDNPIEFDLILTKMMGFDYKNCRGLNYIIASENFRTCYDEIFIHSNIKEFNKNINDILFSNLYEPFEPADGWKNYIELDKF